MAAEEQINILMVDDSPQNLLALEAILHGPDRNLVSAGSGDDALRYLLDNEVAVILMDVFMPGVDGISAARQIKGDPRLQHIPILAWTARPSAVENHPALFAAVVPKPGTPDAVVGAIRALLPA